MKGTRRQNAAALELAHELINLDATCSRNELVSENGEVIFRVVCLCTKDKEAIELAKHFLEKGFENK